ncbi:MAG: hypothetical protein J6R32_02540 [Bacteroidales bacterium]|nr:hypothetical protein [Bacteroidales bacterium]
MQFGDTEITKEQMPSFNWLKDNPDHMYGVYQDIYANFNNVQQQQPMQPQGMASQEMKQNQWS